MAAHSSQNNSNAGPELPDIVPFTLPYLNRLSWELGSRTIEDNDASCHSRWEHTEAPWTLAIFRATSQTSVICVRTPTGREQFYGVAQLDLKSALTSLNTASCWQQCV
ncbi:hypothetical protein DMJ13_25725 [halophilic archaeon]|nr:hypothetical protein DMJ13_25725 [halophilic archaeon]